MNDRYKAVDDTIKEIDAELTLLRAENTKLREALEFYADKANYISGDTMPRMGALIAHDRGERAIKALKGEE